MAAATDEIGDQPKRNQEASAHDGESDKTAFLETLFPHFVAVEHFSEEENHRESQHRQEDDVGGVFQRRALNCFCAT